MGLVTFVRRRYQRGASPSAADAFSSIRMPGSSRHDIAELQAPGQRPQFKPEPEANELAAYPQDFERRTD